MVQCVLAFCHWKGQRIYLAHRGYRPEMAVSVVSGPVVRECIMGGGCDGAVVHLVAARKWGWGAEKGETERATERDRYNWGQGISF
jgi:hypothetical protein